MPSLLSSVVERLLRFYPDGPGVRRHDLSTTVDTTGVDTFVELIGDDAKVTVLHDDVARYGGQDLLTVFVPAAGHRQ